MHFLPSGEVISSSPGHQQQGITVAFDSIRRPEPSRAGIVREFGSTTRASGVSGKTLVLYRTNTTAVKIQTAMSGNE